MKIAVTYDNGEIFQHFGKTENFKIFEVENGAIISIFLSRFLISLFKRRCSFSSTAIYSASVILPFSITVLTSKNKKSTTSIIPQKARKVQRFRTFRA